MMHRINISAIVAAPKSKPQKQSAHDHVLLYTIAAALVVLAIGFVLASFYRQQAERKSVEITYIGFPGVAVSRDGHSIRASFAVRVSVADAEWASTQKQPLEHVMKQALMEADPVRVRAPEGLKALQEGVRSASNAALKSNRVQEVLVTDLLVSEGDY